VIDTVHAGFFARQREAGRALAAASDRLVLTPLGGAVPQRYVAEFDCNGLARAPSGEIVVASRFVVGISFSDEHLRKVEPYEVLTLLAPRTAFHPNVSVPFMCVGGIAPGTELVDLLYRCFELVSWQRVTAVEAKALDPVACVWARNHRHRWPVDTRPLKRRAAQLVVEPVERRP
jgi:hypothetical protein